MDLFQDDDGPSTSSSSSAPSFSVNKAYANKFEHNKARAELQRLDEKYSGKGPDDEDGSSDDETEDEQGQQITPEVDAAILRTIARIRAKDTAIYQDGKKVFDDERALASSSSLRPKSSSSKPPSRKEKKMNLASYQRSRMEELIKTSSDPAKAFADATSFSAGQEFGYGSNQDQGYGNRNDDGEGELLAPAQEQEKLKREVRDAFNNFNNDDDEDGGFFVKRDLDQEALEGDDYRKYLLLVLEESGGGEKAVREALKSQIEEAERGDDGLRRKVRVGEDENLGDDTAAADDGNRDESEEKEKEKKEQKKGKEKKKKKSKEEKDEDFLMNYILNRGWMDDSAPSGPSKPSLKSLKSKRDAPKQSTSDSDSDSPPEDLAPSTSGKGAYGRDWEAEAAELESEASFDSKAEAFETAYNFRYEQMESGETGSNIASFARDPKGSVRRKDEKRKLERENKKERKEKAKKEKLGELNRYAELKRKDILERVKKLREATGSQAIGFEDLDLDADFDPDAHDRAMNGAFNDEYYQEGEEADFAGEGDYDENVKYDADGKPIWDDDIDIGDIMEEDEEEEEPSSKKSKKSKGKKKPNDYDEEEDGPIEMDADFVDGTLNSNGKSEKEMSKKEKKKLKKKLKAVEEKKAKTLARNQDEDEAVGEDEMDADKLEMKMKLNLPKRESKEEDEPRTEEERRSRLESLKEEYDALDYEDVVGDQPTRFKYTKVPSSSYGLTPVEILLADDSQLNSLIGLKNLQPYKKGGNKRPADMGARLREFRSGLSKNSSFKKNAEEMEKRGWNVEGVNVPNLKDGKKKKRAGKSEREKRKREQAEDGEGEKVEVGNAEKAVGKLKESKEEKEKRKKEKKEKKERKEKNEDESGEPKKKKSKKE